jgi:hypothetical protein
MQKEQE